MMGSISNGTSYYVGRKCQKKRGKVEKSLEKLAELIDKGVEIYSSIETPNEVKALFPMSENNVLLPDNIIKLLEEKSGENKEE